MSKINCVQQCRVYVNKKSQLKAANIKLRNFWSHQEQERQNSHEHLNDFTEANEIQVEMNEDSIAVSQKNETQDKKKQQIGDKLIVLHSGNETWL